MKLGIIIPAYNEEKRIKETLNSYSSYLESIRKSKDFDYFVLVSINNTKDNTKNIVSNISKKNKRVGFIDLPKGGKGYAVIEGFKYLINKDLDYIGFVDADMATSPEAYMDLYDNIKDNDGIIASRYLKGSIVNPRQSFQRILASRIYNFFIRALFFLNFRDTQCGAKIFSVKLVKIILPNLTMSKWAFDVDILYCSKKEGFNIKEHPTTWSDKSYSKINFMSSGPLMALALVRLRLLNSPLHSLIRIYDKLLNRIINLR